MRILAALDASDKDDAVLRAVATLADAANAEVVLLSMLDPMIDAADIVADTRAAAMEQKTAERTAYLEGRAAALLHRPVRAHAAELQHGDDVAQALAREAEEQSADILAIASKRAGGLGGFMLGSVAQAVLKVSPCPVLVVRPPEG